jgi:hypothetical protein
LGGDGGGVDGGGGGGGELGCANGLSDVGACVLVVVVVLIGMAPVGSGTVCTLRLPTATSG